MQTDETPANTNPTPPTNTADHQEKTPTPAQGRYALRGTPLDVRAWRDSPPGSQLRRLAVFSSAIGF
jgi:hypothetical protein